MFFLFLFIFSSFFNVITSIHIHNMSSYHAIIVAVRYRDPLPTEFKHQLWFAKYPHIVYNRGKGEFPSNYNTIDVLENCGREGFVYLKHIYENYQNLPEITIFAQYDHLTGVNECPDVTSIMKGSFLPNITNGYASVGSHCLDDRVRVFLYGYERWGRTLEDVQKQQSEMLGPEFVVSNPRYIPTAFYAVTREAIQRNPPSFYRRLAQLLNYDENPWQGHFIERSWPEIFHAKCVESELYCCRYAEPHCQKEEPFHQLAKE